MLKALKLQTFAFITAIIVATVACTFYAKQYVLQQHEDVSKRENLAIASQINHVIEPFMPRLFNQDILDSNGGTNTTDFIILNEINQAIAPHLTDSPVTQIYIKDNQNQTLFSKGGGMASESIFKQLSTDGTLKNTKLDVFHINNNEMLTSSATPILSNTNTQAGVLYLVTDHSKTRIAAQQKLEHVMKWVQGFSALLVIVAILFHLNNLKLYQKLSKRLKELGQSLKESQEKDSLTSLLNRKSLFKHINQLKSENAHHAFANFTVFLIDVDKFKSINETHGHSIGDNVLKQTSQRIKNAVPKQSIIARLQGNTFCVVVENTIDLQHTSDIANNILNQFTTPFNVEDKNISCTASIGIVMANQDQHHAEDIVRDAEMSMYRAKHNGRGTYEIFTPNMHIESLQRFKTERDIQRGIKAKEIFNRYQPIVDLKTGLTHSFEALARWQHPEKGELAPYHFIDIAEEAGLIGDIDRNALAAALQDLSEWHKDLPTLQDLKVNVNHSAQEFNQRPTMDIILEQLSKNHLSPQCLKIELTESSIIDNEAVASTIFESLREKGIHFCMDDFGTGFSSISYLRKLNFDMLKIDRSFVADIMEDEESRKIVQTIINMGDNLGISVTAEGIETEEQMNILKDMGCTFGQGYYFARPMLKSDVIGFLKKQIEDINASNSVKH